jgi:hypothetical protein
MQLTSSTSTVCTVERPSFYRMTRMHHSITCRYLTYPLAVLYVNSISTRKPSQPWSFTHRYQETDYCTAVLICVTWSGQYIKHKEGSACHELAGYLVLPMCRCTSWLFAQVTRQSRYDTVMWSSLAGVCFATGAALYVLHTSLPVSYNAYQVWDLESKQLFESTPPEATASGHWHSTPRAGSALQSRMA